MQDRFSINSPGKINLHLDILSKRQDGFHEIVTIIHAVELADRLEFRIKRDGAQDRLIGSFPCPTEENLITRGIKLFRKILGTRERFDVTVTKRIPPGSGLGGGSSNCAATLRGLNALYDHPFSPGELIELGAELGSDIPFFLGESTAALATGRGELLHPLNPLVGFEVVLAFSGVKIDTADAYHWYDSWDGRGRGGLELREVERVYGNYESEGGKLHNTFEEVIYPRFPELEAIHSQLSMFAGANASLSGSGSTVFAIFRASDGNPHHSSTNFANFTKLTKVAKVIMSKTLERWDWL